MSSDVSVKGIPVDSAEIGKRSFRVLFLACFAMGYILHKPEQALGRTFALAFFAVVTSISNEQSYSFMALANVVLMVGLVLLVLYFSSSLQVIGPGRDVMLTSELENA